MVEIIYTQPVFIFNVCRMPCNRLITQHLIKHTAQSAISNRLSFTCFLHVSTSTRSSSGIYSYKMAYSYGKFCQRRATHAHL